MSESFRGLILARFWETRGFLLLFDCPKVLRWDSQIKGKDFLELFPGLKSEDHLFFFCGEQTAAAERKRGPSTVLQRLPQYIKRQIFHFHHFHLCQIYHDPQASYISRGRFYISIIFIFVKYIIILKPHYIKRKIFNFHLCWIYQPPQASTLGRVEKSKNEICL